MREQTPRSDCIPNIRPNTGGGDDALDKYLAHHRSRWVGMANRFLARLRIDKADLDGEGAVDLTFAKFYRESDRGRLISINDSVDFQKQMTVHLKRVIGDEYKRSQAIKRVGDGMSRSKKTDKPSGTATINRARRARGLRRTDPDLDTLPSRLDSSEDLALVNEEVEVLLVRVEDPALRTIIRMRVDGYNRKEIATHLGVTERTVQRKLATIRGLYPDPPEDR